MLDLRYWLVLPAPGGGRQIGELRLDPDTAVPTLDAIDAAAADAGYEPGQVTVVQPAGCQPDDADINRLLAELANHGIMPILDCVTDLAGGRRVYLVVQVSKFGAVEFQVSDGPPGDRAGSADFYAYSDAIEEFRRQCGASGRAV